MEFDSIVFLIFKGDENRWFNCGKKGCDKRFFIYFSFYSKNFYFILSILF